MDNRTLQNALDLGHRLLDDAIAKGEQPAESKTRVIDEEVMARLALPGRDFDA